MKNYIFISILIAITLLSCKKVEYETYFSGWQVIRLEDFIMDFDVDSNNNIYLLEPYERLSVSRDIGDSWENSFAHPTNLLYSASINEETQSYIIGSDGYLAYTKGSIGRGTYWYNYYLDKNYSNTAISNIGNLYWIIGTNSTNSKVYRKETNSSMWISKLIPAPYIRNIFFIDKNKGWAIGDYKVFTTNNSGVNWVLQMDDPESTFTSIDFINTNEGWLSTDYGDIYHSINSGDKWTKIYSNPDYVIRTIDFIDEKTGWAAGYNIKKHDTEFNGLLMYTRDGGHSWTEHPFQVDAIWKIKFSDDNTGYAMGDKFIIYTNSGGH